MTKSGNLLGRCGEQSDTLGGEGTPRDRRRQCACVLIIQGAEPDLGQASGRTNPAYPVDKIVAAVGVVIAAGSTDEHRRLRGELQKEGDEVQRLLITPLQIVDDQKERLTGLQQRSSEPLEEAVLLPGIRHGTKSDIGGSGVCADRRQPLQLDPPDGVERRGGFLDGWVAQPIGDRRQGQPPRGAKALSDRDYGTLVTPDVRDLRQKSGLADTCRSFDDGQPGFSRDRCLPGVSERRHL